MATISELLKEKNTLPKGNIYKKKINGKVYYYHQYFYNGDRITQIIKRDEVKAYKAKIARRKEIEKLIKAKKEKYFVLTKKANELTGSVMSGNEVVARFEKGKLVSINEELSPLVIKRTHSLEKFLQLRSIDMSRTNARILKKVLNINVDEEFKTPLFAYALSISDRYWFKPKHSKLNYNDVSFKTDSLFETALRGEVNVFFHKANISPEITTTGSFEKGWKYINNEWWLYKIGNKKQLFSELFCSEFANFIGINTVRYELENNCIKCKNFSRKYNYEPIASLADDNDNYNNIFSILFAINENVAKDYIKLIFFDSVVNNVDRHNENVGLLRDVKNGKILSLAPNFDNNIALIATTSELNDNPSKDGFIKLFINFLKNNIEARKLFNEIQFKEISEQDIESIIQAIPLDIADNSKISKAIIQRYNYLKNYFNNKHN